MTLTPGTGMAGVRLARPVGRIVVETGHGVLLLSPRLVRLCGAALTLFAERGYHGTAVSQIAAGPGQPRPVVIG